MGSWNERQLVKGAIVEKTVWTTAAGIPIWTNLVEQFLYALKKQ